MIFTGFAGVAALVAAGWIVTTTRAMPSAGPAMSAGATNLLRALVPAFLDGALPEAGVERARAIDDTVAAVATAIAGLPPVTRDELNALFTILSFAPVRIAFAGVDGDWRDARGSDVAGFVDRLRKSRWAVKRVAYDALHQLIFAAWYANPRAWPAIGYPGPPHLA